MGEFIISYSGPNLTENTPDINLGSVPDTTGARGIKLKTGQQVGFLKDGSPLTIPGKATIIARMVYDMIERQKLLVRLVPEENTNQEGTLNLFSPHPPLHFPELGRSYAVLFDPEARVGTLDLNDCNRLTYREGQTK